MEFLQRFFGYYLHKFLDLPILYKFLVCIYLAVAYLILHQGMINMIIHLHIAPQAAFGAFLVALFGHYILATTVADGVRQRIANKRQ